jgi:phage terminase large subunit GpA-like protein
MFLCTRSFIPTHNSESINCILFFYVHADPSNILLVQPTVDLAEEYSKDRIAAGIEATPVLRNLVQDPKSRNSGNTVKSKRYPGGSLVLVGANAPAGLAGRPRRVILKDEIDRFPPSAGTEGDPCSLADKRAETFTNAVKVSTSTATVRGLSKIEALYEQSDKRKWHVCCPKCSHEFVIMWSCIKWNEGEPESAWMECPKNKCKLDDADRVRMVRAGRWVATAPFRGVRGFWLSGLNTLFRAHRGYRNRLHEFVEDFLKAKEGGAQTMRVWINTFLAETYEEEAEKIDGREVLKRVEDYTPEAMPLGVLVLTAGVDIQKNRIEIEVKGWGVDEESWGIQKTIFDGDTEKDEVWAALDAFLMKRFTREDGVSFAIERTFIDMGHKDRRVLGFCAPRMGRGIFPCRGVNRPGLNPPPLLPAKPSRNNKARILHWNVGVTVAKTAIYDRLLLPVPEPRSMHFPRGYGYDVDYFKQITAEKRKRKFQYGRPYFIFEKDNTATRNEALDLNVYAMAAMASLAPIAWQRLEANLKKQAGAAAVARDQSLREVPPKPFQESVLPKQEAPAAEMDENGKIAPAESPPDEQAPESPEPEAPPPKPPEIPPPPPPVRPQQPRPVVRPRPAFRPRGRGGFVNGW